MNRLIRWSMDHRLLVVAASVLLLAIGLETARKMPVDVFPDLTAPTVTVLTEAHGLAPEEVETLVIFPIESAVNGATGVRRVRSASGVGISIVWVEFERGTDIYAARQIVNEKLQLVSPQLPHDIAPPAMAPISSVMGEILFLSVSWKEAALAPDEAGRKAQTMEARSVADWVLRKRLLSVPGVSQVVPIGGAVKQYQVLLRPEALQAFDVGFDQVADARCTTNHDGQRSVDLTVRFDDAVRADLDAIAAAPIDTPAGTRVPLKLLASLVRETGPNTISREGVQHKMVVQANVAGRDLSSSWTI